MARVLSALLLIPLVLGVVWFLPPVATTLLAAVAATLAIFEYLRAREGAGYRRAADHRRGHGGRCLYRDRLR